MMVKKTTTCIDKINSFALFLIALATKFCDFMNLANLTSLNKRSILMILIKLYEPGIKKAK